MGTGQRHMECNVAVWSRPWLTGDDKMQVSGKPGCQDLPTKRGLVGGSSNADVHSAEVQGALAFAGKMMNSQENNMYYRKQDGTCNVTSNSPTLTGSVTVVHKAWETPAYTLVGF